MTTPAERLAAAIHMESAAIAPQTSPLIEAAKEVLKENDRLRADLAEFSRLKEYAKSLGQETYLELHAENERLRGGREPGGGLV